MNSTDWEKYRGIFGNKRRVIALERRLEKHQGQVQMRKMRDPLEELVFTVLSQNTNDRNRDAAYANLRKNYKNWEQVLSAPDEELERVIKTGGLAKNKAKSIKGILARLKNRKYDLKYLVNLNLHDALDELTKFQGVGLKTASCVLLFSFGIPAMPVDTHVHRISRRLGLVRETATADQTFHVLMAITPPSLVYPFHIHLIQHGKNICKSQNPRCDECIVRDFCHWFGKQN